MEAKRITDELTELKISNSKNKILIDQLKFIGAIPVKESSRYTYFRFGADISKTLDMLGIRS